MKNAWDDGEPDLVDETTYTTQANTGWSAWNGWSPELEFCEFAAAVVKLHRPNLVIETGVGQGYTTRRVLAALPDNSTYRGFETDSDMAAVIRRHLPEHATVTNGHPAARDYRAADLTILDSLGKLRANELALWWKTARPGAVLLTHDADDQGHSRGTPHHRLARRIRLLRIPGVFLKNPRGGFLGQKIG